MGRAHSKAHIRWPAEIAEHGRTILDWALTNSAGDMERSPMTAACALILSNLREDIKETTEAKPDGRTVKYGVRMAAVHPQTGDFLAFYPWQFDVAGMDSVWRFVSENGWQLFDGLDVMPLELTLADLIDRTNTARVAMSRRADGIAIIRVRFQWQKKRERRNLRRDADPDDVKVSWDTCDAQLNVWIGPNEAAKELEAKEIAVRHPLSGLTQQA